MQTQLDLIERRILATISKIPALRKRDSTQLAQAVCAAIESIESENGRHENVDYEICGSSIGDSRSEWLYDLTWSEIERIPGNEGYKTKALQLVAEFEMSSLDRVMDGDFVKLVQAIARHRLFVFDIEAMQRPTDSDAPEVRVRNYLGRCVEHVEAFEGVPTDARFLMVGYFGNRKNALVMLYVKGTYETLIESLADVVQGS